MVLQWKGQSLAESNFCRVTTVAIRPRAAGSRTKDGHEIRLLSFGFLVCRVSLCSALMVYAYFLQIRGVVSIGLVYGRDAK